MGKIIVADIYHKFENDIERELIQMLFLKVHVLLVLYKRFRERYIIYMEQNYLMIELIRNVFKI